MWAMPEEKHFIFIDESGDPGPAGTPIYILAALHVDEEELHTVRDHLTAFRYHGRVRKEFKDSRGSDKPTNPGDGTHRLLEAIAERCHDGQAKVTATWLDKAKYKANKGPHLDGGPDAASKFRHFQLRLLLERHIAERRWGPLTDIVIDRWSMTDERRRNLEEYLQGNFKLRPVPTVTLVDSLCCDLIQVSDIITRVVRRCVTGTASDTDKELCSRMVSLHEITGGIYR
jgi:hypothetical protein